MKAATSIFSGSMESGWLSCSVFRIEKEVLLIKAKALTDDTECGLYRYEGSKIGYRYKTEAAPYPVLRAAASLEGVSALLVNLLKAHPCLWRIRGNVGHSLKQGALFDKHRHHQSGY